MSADPISPEEPVTSTFMALFYGMASSGWSTQSSGDHSKHMLFNQTLMDRVTLFLR